MSLHDIVLHHLQSFHTHTPDAATALTGVTTPTATSKLVPNHRYINNPASTLEYHSHLTEKTTNDLLISTTTTTLTLNGATSSDDTNIIPPTTTEIPTILLTAAEPSYSANLMMKFNKCDNEDDDMAPDQANSSVSNSSNHQYSVTRRSRKRNRRKVSLCDHDYEEIVKVPIENTKEEIENQRRVHIALERNRRKQMNHYLDVLRSIMPPSFSKRGDQASIVGGAINFVKKLDQHLQYLLTHHSHTNIYKRAKLNHHPPTSIFSEFFNFPQYSTMNTTTTTTFGTIKDPHDDSSGNQISLIYEPEKLVASADVEVTMVDDHVSVKLLLRRQPKQLLKMLMGLVSLHLTVLHLNVTSVDSLVFYSISLKMEDECQMSSVKEIATAVYELTTRSIQ